jgi:hypothetical protein
MDNLLAIYPVFSALIFLLVGLTTTTIELDARIKSFDFSLIGTIVSFRNQMLFFKAKGKGSLQSSDQFIFSLLAMRNLCNWTNLWFIWRKRATLNFN